MSTTHAGFSRFLCALGFLASTAATVEAIEQPLLPYLSADHRYAVVGFGALPGFEQPGFDDSGFSLGAAAFGSGGTCPLDSTVQTPWPLFTDLLVRRSFTVPADASAVKVAVAIDNDAQVFVNGVEISGGLQLHEFCATLDSFVFSVPDSILNFGSSNLLAVRARDRGGLSFFDVEVRADLPDNLPPDCDGASANPTRVWPPNHKLVPVTIVGVTDPDGDPTTVAVTAVTQDEPVDATGSGKTSPDAVLQGGGVRLRAERAGSLNGRVYQVHFTADDGRGGVCSGAVAVCVPHDQKAGGASCVDDGQFYDSTEP